MRLSLLRDVAAGSSVSEDGALVATMVEISRKAVKIKAPADMVAA